MTETANTSSELLPEADSMYGHAWADDLWWNESAWFGFSVPEKRINGFFYFWHRPNVSMTAAGVALWDGNGEHRDSCLYYHWFPFNPLPAGADMFDFALQSGMSVQTIEPLKEYRLRHETTTCTLDLRWRGITPAQDMAFGETEDDGSADFGDFHYEQFGHVQGSIVVDGERFEVDGPHIRDRSWGVRRPFQPLMRGGLEMCCLDWRTGFCATMITPDVKTVDEGSVDDHIAYGMMLKDGVLSKPVTGQRRVSERGRDGRPQVIEVNLADAEGRELQAVGYPRNLLKYNDLWFVHWSLTEWEIDGEHGWGESQELFDVDVLRRHQRNVGE